MLSDKALCNSSVSEVSCPFTPNSRADHRGSITVSSIKKLEILASINISAQVRHHPLLGFNIKQQSTISTTDESLSIQKWCPLSGRAASFKSCKAQVPHFPQKVELSTKTALQTPSKTAHQKSALSHTSRAPPTLIFRYLG